MKRSKILEKRRTMISEETREWVDFSFKIADKNKTVQTVALPVSNKVIVLDAGHRETR